MNYSQLMNRNDTKPDEWQTSQRFVNVGLRPLKIPLFLYQIRQNLKLKQKQINCSSLKMERYVTWINMGKRCVEKLMMNSNEDDTPTFVQPTLWVFFSFTHKKVHVSIKISHKQQVQQLAITLHLHQCHERFFYGQLNYTCWLRHYNVRHWDAGLFTGTVRNSGPHHRSTLN